MNEERWWAVDVEGNGARPPEIVELALVELQGLELTGRTMHWRVRPETKIGWMATKIHGIRNEDVADAPAIEDIADDVATWLKDRPIVGHNVRIELDILSGVLEGWRPRAAVDTLKLSRRFLPDRKSHALENLGNDLDLAGDALRISGGRAHSAPYDATMCALLLRHLLSEVSDEMREAAIRDADILAPRQESLL